MGRIIYRMGVYRIKLEQLERLRSEDTPRRPMITHTIDQVVLNPKSMLLTSWYRIPSQKKVKAEKIRKICEKSKLINLELKTLQSGHDFKSQGRMTLRI